MLPSVVPPVFRLRADPRRALVPPYSFSGGFLCNATELPWPEVEALRDAREITLFDRPIAARPRYELWLDQSFGWHYQPREQAHKTLDRIATDSINGAKAALAARNFEEAERLSGVAISANDRLVAPFAIRAAIRRLQDNVTGEALMAELAARVLDKESFTLLVTECCRSAQRAGQHVSRPGPRRPMHQVAAAA
jgi:hypothetical protein